VIRFCKRIGAAGFNEFKLWLARDVFRDKDERFLPDLDLESETPVSTTIREVIDSARRSLSSLARTLDPVSLELAARRVHGASMTMLFGVGASGVVASDFHQKLLRVGLHASFAADTHVQITGACSLKIGDLAFVVSYSGETEAMVEAARQAKGRGAYLVTLTMETPNTVRSLADLALLVPASERVYRRGAETSRLNQLTVIDVLYRLIVSENLDSSIEALERSMEATHRIPRR
jgi:RpiR family carbohydrate utilization transcriptional regulator